MRFSKEDAGVIKKYKALRQRVWEVLGSLGEEVMGSYELEWDGVDYEQGGYFFHRFRGKGGEISPGIKVSGKHIVQPVLWVAKDASGGAALEKMGFKEDPEFRGYLIKECGLGEDFFDRPFETQKEGILELFTRSFEELEEAGVIGRRAPRYYAAG